jgi:hypothetical protein
MPITPPGIGETSVFLLDKIRIPNKKNPEAKLTKLETVVICPKCLGIFIGLFFLLAAGMRPHRIRQLPSGVVTVTERFLTRRFNLSV